MATTSFSESFTYGSRLFGLFLSLLFVGGGLLGLGVVLVVPEVQAWRGSGSAETTIAAGGLVLGVLGLSVLISGQFAIVYKLIADGVSRGNADPAVGLDAGSSDAAAEDGQADDAATEPTAHASAEQEPGTADEAAESPKPQQHPEPPDEGQPATPSEPAQSQSAEEIVFGNSEESSEQPSEAEPTEETGDFEFEETDGESREDVETAGDSSSDPLADNFDDE